MTELQGISIPASVADRQVTLRDLLLVVGLFKKLMFTFVEDHDEREILLENIQQVERRLLKHG